MIPYAKPWIEKDDIQAVQRVMEKGQWLTQGPEIEEFEEKLCEYTGAKYAVAVSSGTAALFTIADIYLSKAPQPITTTPITFKATSNAILKYCQNISYLDIDLETYNVSSEYCQLPTDMAGLLCEGGDIIDSSHSLNRNMDMDICMARTLSFHAIKNITTLGEGGAIITDEGDIYQNAKEYRNHNIGGQNYRMTCCQAAMGISQLKKADRFKERKLDIFHKYLAELSGWGLILPRENQTVFWHLFIIRTEKRDEMKAKLFERGIETQIHYEPLADLPNAKEYYRTVLSLPFYASISLRELNLVIENIKGVCDELNLT